MKNRAFWRWIEAMPPIDFALLAAERTRTRRHTPKTIKKIAVARELTVKAKRKARAVELAPTAVHRPERDAAKPGSLGALDKMLDAMEADVWYGRTDMQHLSGLKRGTIASSIIHAERIGRLERTRNPAWERRGGIECEFLYRKVEQPAT